MKLAVVSHIRCGEATYERTLLWFPDDMSDDAFNAIVTKARDEYLAVALRFKNEEAPNDYAPHRPIPFERFPGLTVSQVQRDWAENKIVWDAWDAERKQAAKQFVDYIAGQNGIKRFHEEEPEHAFECDWGHNHGVQLDYSETVFD